MMLPVFDRSRITMRAHEAARDARSTSENARRRRAILRASSNGWQRTTEASRSARQCVARQRDSVYAHGTRESALYVRAGGAAYDGEKTRTAAAQ
jgi:hypothetical protein